MMVVAYIALPTDPSASLTARAATAGTFVPFYLLSLFALYQNKAWIWLTGLAAGWIGPLILGATVGFGLYGPLRFWDGFLTFPLVLVAQITWCIEGLPSDKDVTPNKNEYKEKEDDL